MKRLVVTGAAVFAFADSAIVVLALPELVGRFDASVTGVSLLRPSSRGRSRS
jgi:hypothetical protein